MYIYIYIYIYIIYIARLQAAVDLLGALRPRRRSPRVPGLITITITITITTIVISSIAITDTNY